MMVTAVIPSVNRMRAGLAVANNRLSTNGESPLRTRIFFLARVDFGTEMTSK